MATKKIRPARNKQTLQDELAEVQSSFMNREEVDPTTASEEAKRKTALAARLSGLTAKMVTERFGALGLDVQSALDTVRATLVSSAQELEELRELIEATALELEEVHGKEVVASSIKNLIAEYEMKQDAFNAEETSRRAELETKIAATLQAEKERKALADKQRAVENEDYEYKLSLQRREVVDKFEQMMRERTRKQQDTERDLQRGWQEREESLKGQESEVAGLRAQVAGFDAVLDAEKKKAVDGVTRAMSQNHKHEIDMLKAQADSDKRLAEATIRNLEANNATLAAHAESLQARLIAAESRVESIARSAMERDSGKAALEASQRTIETMKDSPTAKR